MPFSTDSEHRNQFIAGLHSLADYLAANPAIPVPAYGGIISVYADSAENGGIAQVNRIARLLHGTLTDEIAIGGHYKAERSFGPVRYQVVSIPETAMAQHYALMSYRDCITPHSTVSDA